MGGHILRRYDTEGRAGFLNHKQPNYFLPQRGYYRSCSCSQQGKAFSKGFWLLLFPLDLNSSDFTLACLCFDAAEVREPTIQDQSKSKHTMTLWR